MCVTLGGCCDTVASIDLSCIHCTSGPERACARKRARRLSCPVQGADVWNLSELLARFFFQPDVDRVPSACLGTCANERIFRDSEATFSQPRAELQITDYLCFLVVKRVAPAGRTAPPAVIMY